MIRQEQLGAVCNSHPCIVYATCLACLLRACVPCAAVLKPPIVPSVQQHCCSFFEVACGVVLSAAPSCTLGNPRTYTHTQPYIDMGGCGGGLVGHTRHTMLVLVVAVATRLAPSLCGTQD